MTDRVTVKKAHAEGIDMDYAFFGHGDKVMVIIPGLSLKKITPTSMGLVNTYKLFLEEYTVYLFDIRDDIPEGYTERDAACDTVKIIKSLGINEFYLYGTSQGGMISQFIAIDFPETVIKLVLASTTSGKDDKALAVFDTWMTLLDQDNRTGLVEDMLRKVYSKTTLDKYFPAFMRMFRDLSDEDLKRFRIMATACSRVYCLDELSRIKCPVLVLGCEGDEIMSVSSFRATAEGTKGELFIYPDTYAHAVYDEAPDFLLKVYGFFTKK